MNTILPTSAGLPTTAAQPNHAYTGNRIPLRYASQMTQVAREALSPLEQALLNLDTPSFLPDIIKTIVAYDADTALSYPGRFLEELKNSLITEDNLLIAQKNDPIFTTQINRIKEVLEAAHNGSLEEPQLEMRNLLLAIFMETRYRFYYQICEDVLDEKRMQALDRLPEKYRTVIEKHYSALAKDPRQSDIDQLVNPALHIAISHLFADPEIHNYIADINLLRFFAHLRQESKCENKLPELITFLIEGSAEEVAERVKKEANEVRAWFKLNAQSPIWEEIESLDLSGARFTLLSEEIIEILSWMPKLKELNLSSAADSVNHLMSLPDSIGRLTSLTTLDMDQNALVTLPKSINALIKLVKLNAFNNLLVSLPDMSQLSSLRILNFQDNKLSLVTTLLKAFTGFKDLVINLKYNPLAEQTYVLLEKLGVAKPTFEMDENQVEEQRLVNYSMSSFNCLPSVLLDKVKKDERGFLENLKNFFTQAQEPIRLSTEINEISRMLSTYDFLLRENKHRMERGSLKRERVRIQHTIFYTFANARVRLAQLSHEQITEVLSRFPAEKAHYKRAIETWLLKNISSNATETDQKEYHANQIALDPNELFDPEFYIATRYVLAGYDERELELEILNHITSEASRPKRPAPVASIPETNKRERIDNSAVGSVSEAISTFNTVSLEDVIQVRQQIGQIYLGIRRQENKVYEANNAMQLGRFGISAEDPYVTGELQRYQEQPNEAVQAFKKLQEGTNYLYQSLVITSPVPVSSSFSQVVANAVSNQATSSSSAAISAASYNQMISQTSRLKRSAAAASISDPESMSELEANKRAKKNPNNIDSISMEIDKE